MYRTNIQVVQQSQPEVIALGKLGVRPCRWPGQRQEQTVTLGGFSFMFRFKRDT